jgi:hypothetical protein
MAAALTTDQRVSIWDLVGDIFGWHLHRVVGLSGGGGGDQALAVELTAVARESSMKRRLVLKQASYSLTSDPLQFIPAEDRAYDWKPAQ